MRAEGDRVATGDARQSRGAVGRADVDPLIADFGGLAALGFGDEVRRPLAHDAVDRALAPLDDDRAAGQQQRLDAAQPVEVDEPLLVDPGHLQPDLVGVSGHDDMRRAARIDRGGDVAQDVGLGGGDRRDAPAYDLLDGLFKAARPGSRHQFAQKPDIGRHDAYLLAEVPAPSYQRAVRRALSGQTRPGLGAVLATGLSSSFCGYARSRVLGVSAHACRSGPG